ncbi:ABC transporter substrate-binding protein [Dechloromonas denitrificans]|uniref:ABC transporter substrate-binding protein n=1 Tax=Dechloromonas denitrificans TaxID=281362 RepID=UPI001CF933C4|nr:ABC transporter substrate-binding protein [Dechloromonas denitrificans]UCV09966.1 ABC transporter substrate-binding protein [Dechloromonas denitrificans]
MFFSHLRRHGTQLAVAATLALSLGQATAESLKIGFLPISTHAKFMVAKEAGFYAQEGFDAELIEFINSADGLNALNAHKIDVGAFGTSAPLIHIAKGSKIKVIGGIVSGGSSFIIRPENAALIKSPADFKGKKIATVRLSTVDAILRAALKDAGLDWKKDVQIFELKSAPAVTEAVKSGQADIGATWGPHDLRAEEQGLKVLFHSTDLYPAHVCCRLVVTEDGKSAEIWQRFLRAMLRAEKFVVENHKETIDIVSKYVKLDKGLLDRDLYNVWVDQSTDPYLNGVRKFWDTMQHSEFIPPKGDITPSVDLKLYDRALTSLARENPKDPYWQKLIKDFKTKNKA